MRILSARLLAFGVVALVCPVGLRAANAVEWHIAGDLSEACTCSVPCPCNFGEQPAPTSHCWALFSLNIKKGSFGDINLDHQKLAFAGGAKGYLAFIDKSTPARQAAALQEIALAIVHNEWKADGVDPAKKPIPMDQRFLGLQKVDLRQRVGDRDHGLAIGNLGGFQAQYIMGIDGKTPVTVENNYSWNIHHGIKAKAAYLRYHDSFGNRINVKGSNSNEGSFDWSDKTAIYFR